MEAAVRTFKPVISRVSPPRSQQSKTDKQESVRCELPVFLAFFDSNAALAQHGHIGAAGGETPAR